MSCFPCKVGVKDMQELIALYFIFLFSNSPNTIVQAPHPPSAHPSLVPVFFNLSLIKLSIVWFGSGFSNSINLFS